MLLLCSIVYISKSKLPQKRGKNCSINFTVIQFFMFPEKFGKSDVDHFDTRRLIYNCGDLMIRQPVSDISL